MNISRTAGLSACAVVAVVGALALGPSASALTPSGGTTTTSASSAAQTSSAPTVSVELTNQVDSFARLVGTGAEGATIHVKLNGLDYRETTVSHGTWSVLVDLPGSYLVGKGTLTFDAAQVVQGEVVGSATTSVDFGAAITKPFSVTGTSVTGDRATVTGTGASGSVVIVKNPAGDVIATGSVKNGAWSLLVSNLPATTTQFSFFQETYGNTWAADVRTLERQTTASTAPSPATPAERPVAFTAPANPAAGYAPGTSFTFRGTATPGSTITLTNDKGTVIATGLPVGADGTWSWTRANLGTSTWKLTATATGGTTTSTATSTSATTAATTAPQRATLGAFAPIK